METCILVVVTWRHRVCGWQLHKWSFVLGVGNGCGKDGNWGICNGVAGNFGESIVGDGWVGKSGGYGGV